jgi:hypothetical protein
MGVAEPVIIIGDKYALITRESAVAPNITTINQAKATTPSHLINIIAPGRKPRPAAEGRKR